jgi:hypothetical protein
MPKQRKGFPEGPRGDFQMTASWMLWRLWTLVRDTESIGNAELEWGYWYSDTDEEADTPK